MNEECVVISTSFRTYVRKNVLGKRKTGNMLARRGVFVSNFKKNQQTTLLG